MAIAGHPLDATAGPVITDFPIWLAESQRIPALALPDEPPATSSTWRRPGVPGTHLLVARGREPRPVAGGARHRDRGRGLLPRDRPRRPAGGGPDPLGGRSRVRGRLSMRDDPYTPKSMEAARSEARCRRRPLRRSPRGGDCGGRRTARTRCAASASGTTRRTPRSSRAGRPYVTTWSGRGRAAGPSRPRPTAPRARRIVPRHAAADRCRRAADERLREEVDQLVMELADHQAELASIELASKTLERAWLFLERGDDAAGRRSGRPRRPRTSRCGSSRPRRPSGRGSPRRSTTARRRPSSNAIFQVEFIERVLARIRDSPRTELELLRELLRRELGDVRAFISQLRPPLLDELGLSGAIEDAVEHVGP